MPHGKQVEFFMVREDEEEFIHFLFSTGDALLVRDEWYPEKEYEAYSDSEKFFQAPVTNQSHNIPRWLIWLRGCFQSDLVFEHIPSQRCYEIRMDVNYVVEFTRCVMDRGAMESGRLACLEDYEDDQGVFHKKSPEFSKWYRSLQRWISKRGARASFDGKQGLHSLFIMPGALKYYHQGGKLGTVGRKVGAFRPLEKDGH